MALPRVVSAVALISFSLLSGFMELTGTVTVTPAVISLVCWTSRGDAVILRSVAFTPSGNGQENHLNYCIQTPYGS